MEKENKPQDRLVIEVDCSKMEPPEPLIKVSEALNKMGNNQMVKMIHRQPPHLLIPKLEHQGYVYHMDQFADGSIELWIWQEEE